MIVTAAHQQMKIGECTYTCMSGMFKLKLGSIQHQHYGYEVGSVVSCCVVVLCCGPVLLWYLLFNITNE